MSDEFYVGYAPPMPPRLATFIKRAAAVVSIGTVSAAAVLALGHRPLEGGSFAFGERHAITGVIAERPYPALDSLLLVAPGKHGAGELVRGLDGVRVSLEGARIQRNGRTMVEVIPGSIVTSSDRSVRDTAAAVDADQPERVSLRGEIVDSKCFLGVMVPGNGRTHRECASLCLRGGIPPALFVRDADGPPALLLLETDRGEPIDPHRAAALAGKRVEITGLRGQRAGWPTLQSDPATWTLLSTAR